MAPDYDKKTALKMLSCLSIPTEYMRLYCDIKERKTALPVVISEGDKFITSNTFNQNQHIWGIRIPETNKVVLLDAFNYKKATKLKEEQNCRELTGDMVKSSGNPITKEEIQILQQHKESLQQTIDVLRYNQISPLPKVEHLAWIEGDSVKTTTDQVYNLEHYLQFIGDIMITLGYENPPEANNL